MAIAEKKRQESIAYLNMQVTEDEKLAEKLRKELYTLENEANSISKKSLVLAEQQARVEKESIQADCELEIAEIKAKIHTLEASMDIEYLNRKREIELDRKTKLRMFEIEKKE
jgi:hypothetical protein